MDRLTFDGNFCDIAQCTELPCKEGMCSPRLVWERLKVYEDAEEFERMSESKHALSRDECEAAIAAKLEEIRDIVTKYIPNGCDLCLYIENGYLSAFNHYWDGGCNVCTPINMYKYYDTTEGNIIEQL